MKETISTKLEEDILKKIKNIAKRERKYKSQILRELIEKGVEDDELNKKSST